MSLLLGMINVDGAPLDATRYALLYNTLQLYPHVAVHQQKQVSGAISCWLTLDTPDTGHDTGEVERCAAVEPEFVFAAVGRIDNRAELAHALGCRHDATVSDAQLMRASYLRWREDAADRLAGDWAFVAWHPRDRQLRLVRDQHGYTSLYYHFDGRTLVFCSVIDPLLLLTRESRQLNTELLVSMQMLIPLGGVDASHTWYRDVYRLPPAHQLALDAASLRTRRHWFPETVAQARFDSVNTCAAELRSLLDSAVAARLSGQGPVAAMLSGGLDSGTVTCLAAAQLRERGQALRTYSHVPLHEPSASLTSGQIGDESPYIQAVVAAMGNLEPHYLDSRDISPLAGILRVLDIVKEPIHGAANLYWMYDIYSRAARDGATALLTGECGNASISFAGLDYLQGWRRLLRQQGLLRTIKKKLLRPCLHAALRRLRDPRRVPVFAYLRPELLQRYEPATTHFPDTHFTCSRDFALKVLLPGQNPRCYLGGVFSQHFGLELRDPTADRRVIEYCLSIPNDLFFDDDGRGKNVLRRMMTGTLPPMTLATRGKGLQSADLGLRLAHSSAQIDAVLPRLERCEAVVSLMDMAALRRDWHIIKGTVNNRYRIGLSQHFLRALMTAIFVHDVYHPATPVREGEP